MSAGLVNFTLFIFSSFTLVGLFCLPATTTTTTTTTTTIYFAPPSKITLHDFLKYINIMAQVTRNSED
jgi:hypothetical protein